MKRRTFIIASFLTTIGIFLSFIFLDFRRVVLEMLKIDTRNFRLSNADALEAFVSEADRELYWNQFSRGKKAFICVQHLFYNLGIKLPYHEKYLQYRSVITGQFLLSTDLFQGDPHSKNKIVYKRFFNPYKTPCGNPFAAATGETTEIAMR